MKKLMKMVLSALCLVVGAGVAQAEPVSYLDYEPATKSFVNATHECTLVTNATRELAGGWYAVKGNVVLEEGANITVTGDAHLILCDGASLTIGSPTAGSAAIRVGASESLTIYGCENGTGELDAFGGSFSAGIGADASHSCGTVTINGGIVSATGYRIGAAGIGGSAVNGMTACGTVTINGGLVTARGGSNAAGIGGGNGGAGGTVTINGGAIDAMGGDNASEIGPGSGSTQGKVWINGGIFTTRPKDEWLATFRIVVENTDDATKVRYGHRVILNAVAYAIVETTKIHVNKYGETSVEITGTQTNECGCLADAIAAAQAVPQGSVELVTNVNETVQVAGDGAVSIDLKGYTWAPSPGEDDVIIYDGSNSNLVLNVRNGTLLGNLRLGTEGGGETGGVVSFGPMLVSDGDICVMGGAKCVLMPGFKSTYEKVYSTQTPLIAMEDAEFACNQSLEGGNGTSALAFPISDLELVPTKDGTFRVGSAGTPIDNRWSYDLDKWMKDLPDETRLGQICFPASHNAGASGTLGRWGIVAYLSAQMQFKTQDLDVAGQLKSGVRVLDLRFMRADSDKDVFCTFHAPSVDKFFGMTGQSLDEVLTAIDDFLKANPSEVVIAELTHWGDQNKMKPLETQEKVLDLILKTLGDRVFKANEGIVKRDDKTTWPILNDVQLKDLRGKVILAVQPADGPDPINPLSGIWGLKDWNQKEVKGNAVNFSNGYLTEFSDYAGVDDYDDMRKDQAEKWKNVSNWNEDAKNTLPICLSWTLTATTGWSIADVAIGYGLVIIALLVLLVAFIVSARPIAAAALKAWLWVKVGSIITTVIGILMEIFLQVGVGYKHVNIRKFADKLNPEMAEFLKDGVEKKQYNVPFSVFYDFVEPKYNKAIIDLNTHLVPYAAEVVNGVSHEVKKYERLNDAFTNTWLKAASNRCTVKLLRQEEPGKEDNYQYVVPANTFFTFDLNGKLLRRPENGADKGVPILVNNGTVEIVSTQPEGGFDGRKQWLTQSFKGAAIRNLGSLTVKGIPFSGFMGMGANGVIYNGGKLLSLEKVSVSSTWISCVFQGDGGQRTVLADCDLASAPVPACGGSVGTVEMSGGHISSFPMPIAVSIDGRCQFEMKSGEIASGAINVADAGEVTIYDGFVKGSGDVKSCFVGVSGDSKVSVFSGCFGYEVPKGYIVDGKCEYVGTYLGYPYEVVPCDPDGKKEIARVVETKKKYPSVQAAIDAVEAAGGYQTIELLNPTHPVKTLEFPTNVVMTLDLMGYRITKLDPKDPAIRNRGTLTLVDSSTNATGAVAVFGLTNGCVRADAGGIVLNEGTFTLRGGTLCDAGAQRGGGIYNATNACCFIDGGTVLSCQASEKGGGICNDGLMVQRGGVIADCKAGTQGGGVWNGGSATCLGGEIVGCSAATAGGIVNENEYALFGGVISNVTAEVGAEAILADGISLTTLCGVSVKESIGKAQRWSTTTKMRIYEGLFGQYPEATWIQPGSKCVANADAATSLDFPHRVTSDAVAQAGQMKYATLQAAFDATAQSADEVPVKLLKPVTRENAVLRDGCKAALDLAGLWVLSTKDALTVSTNAQLRIVDSVGGGKVGFLFPTNLAETCAVRNYGTCRIEGGRYNDVVLKMDSAKTMSVKAGLFTYHPDNSWIDPGSRLKVNDDPTTCLEYGFVVESHNVARFKDDPDGDERMTLARALRSEKLVGDGALRTIQLTENAEEVAVTVPAGRRGVLDLCGRWLRGKAHEPVITVEKGASLVIVDSVGGGLITKDDVHPQDSELKGAIVNYGELELASGAISNCFSYAEAGGVYNAKGARFVMSGGRIVGCGMLEDKQRDRAAGVCNKGEFWMTGGEIIGCEAANGVMGVYNDKDAVFRQLGGRIEDCLNNADRGAYVRNDGSYVLVDGRIADTSATDQRPVFCIYIPLGGGEFVVAWGEVSANQFGSPISTWCAAAPMNERIGNGKFTGAFSDANVKACGGFFTTDISRDPNVFIPDDICTLTTNDDVVTSGDYPYCVKKIYEVEVLPGEGPSLAPFTCSTLAEALSDNTVKKFQEIYGFFPTNMIVRLLSDVKDCVECTILSEDYPEIAVTLDLNGFSLTGTGATRTFPGRCDPVVENHGRLRIVDSSADKTGFIAMSGICEPAWDGGAIHNAGYLELEGLTIFGCRADRGGAVFNAKDGTVRMKNVRLLGCWAGNDAGGDCIFNAGDCELDDCELDLWPDARDPDNVRRGNSIVNSGSLKIGSWSQNRNNDCRIRGGIANECDGLAGTIDISYVLFEQKPNDDWLATAPNQAWCLKTSDEEMRRDYPWTVTSGRKDVLVDYDSQNMMINSIRAVLRSDDAVVYSEEIDLEDAKDGAGRLRVPVPNDGSIIIEVLYTDEFGGMHPITREFNVDSSLTLHLDKSAFFEAESVMDNHAALFPTLAEALQAGVEQVTLLRNVEDVSDSYCVQEGKKVVFDLNGFSVIGTGKAPLFVNEGTLTIRDGSSCGTGRLTNSSEFKGLIECGGAVLNYGVFTLESGTIEDCTAGDYGGGIMGVEHSETYIRGGRILNCQADVGRAVCSRGRFEMTDGAVRESMAFMGSPSNGEEAEGNALIAGGLLGCAPDDYSVLSPTSDLVDNTDDDTRSDYPYRVVDHAASDPIYDVVRVDRAYFTANSTVLQANRIYRFVEDVALTGSTEDPALASALAVTGGTTVLYIDPGVTVALTGSVAGAQSGAGLRVPQFSRVVIAGGGTLLAQGGASTAGADGQSGEAPGAVSGSGGLGGRGGTGAGAAIGGCGGLGGAGGKGGAGAGTASSGSAGKYQKGQAGAAGADGVSGEDMGMVIALGEVTIKAKTCLEAASGGSVGATGQGGSSFRGAGGGGGGGGSGGLPIYAIGGGGGGGAGAGGGGGGAYAGMSEQWAQPGGFGGCGRGGDRNGNDGRLTPGVDLDSGVGDLSLEELLAAGENTGLGGASGAAGLCGESEGFYAGEEVEVDCGGLYGSNFVARPISQHGALRRQIIILDEDDVEICRVEACLGMPLPEITWALLGPKENIRGLFLANGDDSAAALWYDGDLSPKKPRYETDDLGDVRLQVRYGKVVAILGKDTENERKFETLAAAVDEADYGDTISIVGDVRGENVKVPIGMTVVVEQDGKFREPDPGDLRHKYYKVTTRGEGGKTYYTYGLNEEMVVPRFGSSDGTPAMEFVRDDEGKVASVRLNVENVYEDLYYLVYWGLSPLPEEMVPVTWECADEDGTIRVEAPADDESGFYQIRVTDHLDWLNW